MQQLRFYSPQWLYSTRFGRQSHPSSGEHMLYMATGKPAHCKLTIASVITTCFEIRYFQRHSARSTTQNKAVITNNSTTIGLFTTDTSDKNLQPKVSVLQISFLATGHYGVRAKIPTKTTQTYDMRSSPLLDSALSL